MKCPCQSDKNFSECCEPLILGQKPAPTAESLMRSRYSAFATKSLDYLRASLDRQNWQEFNAQATRDWAEKAVFTGLEILRSEESGNKGTVEFKAHYTVQDENHTHHEIGTFRKQQGLWYYKTGKVL